jgi:hypothetical protein
MTDHGNPAAREQTGGGEEGDTSSAERGEYSQNCGKSNAKFNGANGVVVDDAVNDGGLLRGGCIMSALEVVVFTKADNGPLTKRIELQSDGGVRSDGSECRMSKGRVQRMRLADISQLAKLIEALTTSQALALGTLRAGVPDNVRVVTKKELNCKGGANVIARTADDIVYRQRQPAFVLLDFDRKGLPPELAAQLDRRGFWEVLVSVLPALGKAARVIRHSTSAGLMRGDESLPGSGGLHVYIIARDGSDIERFLENLHQRCWLAGYGWLMVSSSGQLLERSIVDRAVGGPERLVFEGPPIVVPPLQQDAHLRRPIVTEGEMIDTIAVCPPLTIVERQALERLRVAAKQRVQPAMNRARDLAVEQLIATTGIGEETARRVIGRRVDGGILLDDMVLVWDDPELEGRTVGDVLDDPAAFEGATLADPLEGIGYGRCKAKIMRRDDGTPWIHSFAHGRTVYELRYGARAIRALCERSTDPVHTFARLVLSSDLDGSRSPGAPIACPRRARG